MRQQVKVSPLPARALSMMRCAWILLGLTMNGCRGELPEFYDPRYPTNITVKAGILSNTVPLAYTVSLNETNDYDVSLPFPQFQGFQPDLLRELITIAKDMHGINFTIDIEEAPPFSYTPTFNKIADNCNTTDNPMPLEECDPYQLLVGDYYAFPPRPLQAHMTPSLLTTAAAAVKFVHRQQRDISTLEEAEALRIPVCLLDYSFYDDRTLERHPDLLTMRCYSHDECIKWLKAEICVLFVEDELQLRHMTVRDPELEVTREKFDEQYVLWPMNKKTMPVMWQELLDTWIFQAKATGVLDQLYDKYFSVHYCPVGFAGEDCTEPCNPSHGVSDRFGNCVCDSTRWSGKDCSIQVKEDLNLLPSGLVIVCYTLVAINFALCGICALWLYANRNRAQVKIAQPSFLLLILLGCVISTSTILALAQADDPGNGEVPACMAIPWLYSVGFSITFGTLFAKIRRIYILLQSAAEMRRITVSVKETAAIVGAVLLIDVAILMVWTLVDPLEWERTVINADKYGYALESEGTCTSDYWVVFATIIGFFHFCLIGVACYMCYLARHVPDRLSNGKYVAIAMFSNMQIFVVAVPVLIVLGSDPQTSFFVRSVAIWVNDFVVVFLVFWNLMYTVHRSGSTPTPPTGGSESERSTLQRRSSQLSIHEDIQNYAKKVKEQQRQEQERQRQLALQQEENKHKREASLNSLGQTLMNFAPPFALEMGSSGFSLPSLRGGNNSNNNLGIWSKQLQYGDCDGVSLCGGEGCDGCRDDTDKDVSVNSAIQQTFAKGQQPVHNQHRPQQQQQQEVHQPARRASFLASVSEEKAPIDAELGQGTSELPLDISAAQPPLTHREAAISSTEETYHSSLTSQPHLADGDGSHEGGEQCRSHCDDSQSNNSNDNQEAA